jgi:hypothetical protein
MSRLTDPGLLYRDIGDSLTRFWVRSGLAIGMGEATAFERGQALGQLAGETMEAVTTATIGAGVVGPAVAPYIRGAGLAAGNLAESALGSKVGEKILEQMRISPRFSELTTRAETKAVRVVETGRKIGGFDMKVFEKAKHHIPELKQIRQAYIQDTNSINQVVENMTAAGANKEEISRTAHQMRREFGVHYKNLTPDELKPFLYDRNRLQYGGDPLGPTFEFLVQEAQDNGLFGDAVYERITAKAIRPNKKLSNFISALEED